MIYLQIVQLTLHIYHFTGFHFFNGVYCFNTITSTFSKDNYRAFIYTPETHCLDFYILFTQNRSVTKQLFVLSKYFFLSKFYLEMPKCLFICTRQRPFLLPVTSEEQVEVIHWQDMDYFANVIPLCGQTLFKDCFWEVFIFS